MISRARKGIIITYVFSLRMMGKQKLECRKLKESQVREHENIKARSIHIRNNHFQHEIHNRKNRRE